MKRLTSLPTLRVDVGRPVPFVYKNQTGRGFKGDTIATALYAAGVRIFSRSLKYHRPRGLFSLDGESSNTMMTVNGVPNVRTETTLLAEGAMIRDQNAIFTARNDLLGFMDRLDRFMPAGFYYETMHKPASLWPVAAKMVRKAAGLGRIAPDFRFSGACDEMYPAADLCVIGGGPAGMEAALAAADQGLRVILLEARPWLGGSFDYRERGSGEDAPLYRQAADLASRVSTRAAIRVFTRTAMVGGYSDNLVTAVTEGGPDDPFDYRYLEMRPRAVVVATGSRERPLIFENNERPGVMLPDCALRLARTYGILAGREAVFSVGHDLGLEAALDLSELGLPVRAVADVRTKGHDPALVRGLADRRIPFYPGWAAAAVEGKKGVKSVRLASCDGGQYRILTCDLLAAAAGHTPAVEPLSLFCGPLAYDGQTGYFLPRTYPAGVFAAGRIYGLEAPQNIRISGRVAGLDAAAFCGADCRGAADAHRNELAALPMGRPASKWVAFPGPWRKHFVDFDEDVTGKHIRQAVGRGFGVPELIKRFTAAGTGPGQGGISGHNLPLLVAAIKNPSRDRTDIHGTVPAPTTVRPPLRPVFLAAYAGSGREMVKRTPVHDAQAWEGAVFRRVGVWHRARYFSADLDVSEEVDNVRTNVGMLDASTLGCFRIFGPDALSALQRVYAGDMSKIKDGRVKYAAMCNHDGCVIDDGVVIRIGENDYMFTTSTGRAGETVEWIRYHTRFDNWDFHLVNQTDGTGVINLAGPRARDVLERVTDADVSNQAFSFGCWKDFSLSGGIPVRCLRLGFVGELSFELNIPASYMQAAWDMLRKAGSGFGLRPFGVEAQNILRLEKGHVILGQESEQRTNLLDLNMGFLFSRDKDIRPVGADALLQAEKDAGRLTLVGIRMTDSSCVPPDGSILVDDQVVDPVIGYVGTIRKSRALDAVVGMALVERAWTAEGTRLAVYDGGGEPSERHDATVVRMPFYDPEGIRMRM